MYRVWKQNDKSSDCLCFFFFPTCFFFFINIFSRPVVMHSETVGGTNFCTLACAGNSSKYLCALHSVSVGRQKSFLSRRRTWHVLSQLSASKKKKKRNMYLAFFFFLLSFALFLEGFLSLSLYLCLVFEAYLAWPIYQFDVENMGKVSDIWCHGPL